MNLYFLVEGKRTEKKVYPAWLHHLLPDLTRVHLLSDISQNSYYIFSGCGYPAMISTHLPNAIKDYKACGEFDRMVVCLDVDDSTPEARKEIVQNAALKHGLPLENLTVITQNSCIETWFLGNPKMVSPNPNRSELCEYVRFYNVRELDPELMGCPPKFKHRSVFHPHYFRLVASEKNVRYTKTQPRGVVDAQYLAELIGRRKRTGQMETLGEFFDLCEEIKRGLR